MGKTQIGSSTISKKMFGNSEVVKEVVNGATVYEKGSGGGLNGTIGNTGFLDAGVYIDRTPATGAPDYVLSGGSTLSVACQSYIYMIYGYTGVYVVSSSGCTYEEIWDIPNQWFGYKVYPTQDGWSFVGDFSD